MTRPIYEPSPSRMDASLDFATQQLFRRPAPTGGSGLAFAAWRSGRVTVSGPANSFLVVDMNPATTPAVYSNDSRLLVVHDPGNTPEYGISVPANFLVRVVTSMWVEADIADGTRLTSWIHDGSYSVTVFSPVDVDAMSSAFSATGLADDLSAPQGLWRMSYMGDTSDWVVGVFDEWTNWTTDPLDFRYGISVEIVGNLPVVGGP